MAELILDKVCKIFGNNTVISDFNLKVADGEFVVLVGPSGCGKSTILRMIAGLEPLSAGEIYINGASVNDVPPKDRDIAMVFQNYALYPHMTVYENMAFGLKLKKYPKDEINSRVKEAAGILGLESLLDRKPTELSGGQLQRVVIAMALESNPKLILLDEPTTALDPETKVKILDLLRKLQADLVSLTQ